MQTPGIPAHIAAQFAEHRALGSAPVVTTAPASDTRYAVYLDGSPFTTAPLTEEDARRLVRSLSQATLHGAPIAAEMRPVEEE